VGVSGKVIAWIKKCSKIVSGVKDNILPSDNHTLQSSICIRDFTENAIINQNCFLFSDNPDTFSFIWKHTRRFHILSHWQKMDHVCMLFSCNGWLFSNVCFNHSLDALLGIWHSGVVGGNGIYKYRYF
jgi:hypothetical protein